MIEPDATISTRQQHRFQHPAIQAVLEALAQESPDPAQRASLSLARLLHNHDAAPNQPEWWNSSQLTGGGFPVEFAFTTADRSVRYTADIGGTPIAPTTRLALAQEMIRHFGEPDLSPQVASALQALQHSGSLRYGAWVGGKHAAGGDRFKLYCEVPGDDMPRDKMPGDGAPDARHLRSALLAAGHLPLPRLPDRAVQLRMVGYEPATQRMEAYFRVTPMATYHLPNLLQPLGMVTEARRLIGFIERLYGYPLRDKVPGGSVGFSYSLGPGGRGVFTLFLFARALWGGDRNIRSKMSFHAQQQGWDPAAYLAITASLAQRNVYQTFHGMVGLTVVPEMPIQISIGLRPPPTAGE
ncbi:MAG: hypothetical protein IT328_14060 [Caldilineaceae bacterium]|nr:hypothetical protein [Caldilineaceae bacterium]